MEELLKKILDMIVTFFSPKEDISLVFETINYIPLFGDKSENSLKLQKRLNKLTQSNLKEDGHFGPATKKALQDFQKSKGLSGSGMIGEKTLEFLGLKVESNFMGTDISTKVYEMATKEIGQKEVKGEQDNPRILEYHQTTGKFSDDSVSWCGSFVSWCLTQCGLPTLGSEGASARAWLKYGKETKSPKKGDIVVFWRVARNSWQGHVAFYDSETTTHIRCLGGNQSDAVNIQSYAKSQLLGFRTYQ